MKLVHTPKSEQMHRDSVARMTAYDWLPASIRAVLQQTPEPFEAHSLYANYRKYGEAFVINAIHEYIAEHYPNFTPLSARRKDSKCLK